MMTTMITTTTSDGCSVVGRKEKVLDVGVGIGVVSGCYTVQLLSFPSHGTMTLLRQHYVMSCLDLLVYVLKCCYL